jgi:hypothetical protein
MASKQLKAIGKGLKTIRNQVKTRKDGIEHQLG